MQTEIQSSHILRLSQFPPGVLLEAQRSISENNSRGGRDCRQSKKEKPSVLTNRIAKELFHVKHGDVQC